MWCAETGSDIMLRTIVQEGQHRDKVQVLQQTNFVNVRNAQGWSLLTYAASFDQTGVVKMLLCNFGVDVNESAYVHGLRGPPGNMSPPEKVRCILWILASLTFGYSFIRQLHWDLLQSTGI